MNCTESLKCPPNFILKLISLILIITSLHRITVTETRNSD